jgi:hypothetical protein
MLRFTIRDVLWLTVVVALAVALWVKQQQIEKVGDQVEQAKRESATWERRAKTLRSDLTRGTNKNTEVEFVPNGIRYIPKGKASEGTD